MPSPYLPGSQLSLSFSCGAVQTSVAVEIVKAFTPFTCSQTLLVHPVSSSSLSASLPDLFILKLVDIRFTPRVTTPEEEAHHYAWTLEARAAFVEGIRRVRSGEWANEWRHYIPEGRTYLPDKPDPGEDPESDFSLWTDEMGHYHIVQNSYSKEVQAYRVFQSLYGHEVPRLLATVSLATGDSEPLLSSVRGIALEYIDGQTLEHFKLGTNLSAEQAERVAQGTLRAVRRIRDCFITHYDLAMRNIMLRRLGPGSPDFDLEHPVIIDFGHTDHWVLGEDDYGDMVNSLKQNMSLARWVFNDAGWHEPSFYLGLYQPTEVIGYARANYFLDGFNVGLRAQYFEEIPEDERDAPRETIDEDGHVCVYEPARWRVLEGVRGSDADVKWEPSRLCGPRT